MGKRGVLGKRSPGKQRLHQRKAAGPCTHFLLGGPGRITLTAGAVLVRSAARPDTGSVSEKGVVLPPPPRRDRGGRDGVQEPHALEPTLGFTSQLHPFGAVALEQVINLPLCASPVKWG